MRQLLAATIINVGLYASGLWGQATNIFPPSGSVGIGTTTPHQMLENAGTRTAFGGDSWGYHWFTTNTGTAEPNSIALGFAASAGTVNQIAFITGGLWRMVIGGNGNVGIGTTNPQYPLSVHGSIEATEVLVQTG